VTGTARQAQAWRAALVAGLTFSIVALGASAAAAHDAPSATALAKQHRLLAHLAPDPKLWVTNEASQLAQGAPLAALRVDMEHAFPRVRAPSHVNVLTFLVLMQAWQDVRQAEGAGAQGAMTPAQLQDLESQFSAAAGVMLDQTPDSSSGVNRDARA
jgi:hypothetical protein